MRDGTLSQADFAESIQPIRAALNVWLEEGASYAIGPKEKTPLAKTARTCPHLPATAVGRTGSVDVCLSARSGTYP